MPSISKGTGALYVILRWGTRDKDAIGFVIKLRHGGRTYAERNGGYAHTLTIGPIYMRTYKMRRIL